MTSSLKVSAVKMCDCNRILQPGSRVIVVPGPTVFYSLRKPDVNCFLVAIAHLLCANINTCSLAVVISNL